MNSNTQTTGLFSTILGSISDRINQTWEMMKAGLGNNVVIPGATGARLWIDQQEQSNNSKSMRQMRKDWGHEKTKDGVGDRRFIRYSSRMHKRKNSFCNNLNPDGSVVMN